MAFVDQLAKAHVNTLVMEVKTSAGIFWPSERFAPAVVAEYRDFDFPAVLIRQCHRRKIALHAWFFDFAEGADSHVARQHPEWLARSPDGKPTTAEIKTCRTFLEATIAEMRNLRAIVTLGRISHESTVVALNQRRAAAPFGHGASHEIGKLRLFVSYHCSRYNTNTGVLTPKMFQDVFASARAFLDADGATARPTSERSETR